MYPPEEIPETVTARGSAPSAGSGSLARAALDLFISCYGAAAGDFALAVLARGGVYVAGGIGSLNDLSALESVGVHAAILGRALYSGGLDAHAVATRYAPAVRPPGGLA